MLDIESAIFSNHEDPTTALQDLDLVTQYLKELSLFLGRVALELPSDQKIDLSKPLSSVPLARLAETLNRQSTAAEVSLTSDEKSNSTEFF